MCVCVAGVACRCVRVYVKVCVWGVCVLDWREGISSKMVGLGIRFLFELSFITYYLCDLR